MKISIIAVLFLLIPAASFAQDREEYQEQVQREIRREESARRNYEAQQLQNEQEALENQRKIIKIEEDRNMMELGERVSERWNSDPYGVKRDKGE